MTEREKLKEELDNLDFLREELQHKTERAIEREQKAAEERKSRVFIALMEKCRKAANDKKQEVKLTRKDIKKIEEEKKYLLSVEVLNEFEHKTGVKIYPQKGLIQRIFESLTGIKLLYPTKGYILSWKPLVSRD